MLAVPRANDMAAKTTIVMGSIIADMVISLELPMPPNALPASSPASAMKNRPSASRYRKSITLPIPYAGSGIMTMGTSNAATSMTEMLTYGAVLIIHDEFGE